MKIPSTTPSLVSYSLNNWVVTESMTEQGKGNNNKKGRKLMKIDAHMNKHTFLKSLTLNFPASSASSQPISPVTSALISGVVILGMIGTAFFLLSVHLLRKSHLQTVTSSGLWNPSFKWLNINFGYMLGKVLKKNTIQTGACVPKWFYVCTVLI